MGKPNQQRKAKAKKVVVVDDDDTKQDSESLSDPEELGEVPVVKKKLKLLTAQNLNLDLVDNGQGASTSITTTVTTGRKLTRKERDKRQKDYVHKENMDEYRDFRIAPPPWN